MHKNNYKKISHIVVEKLSCISFEVEKNSQFIFDEITYKRFSINQTAYKICLLFDGKRSLREITELVADDYDVGTSVVEADIVQFFNFLNMNRLILYKPSIKYYFYKLYKTIAHI
jgi:hypothetical protein